MGVLFREIWTSDRRAFLRILALNILASLANRTSEVDVEQIIGRILRQPHTTKHSFELLNLCYVFTSSADFKQTVEHIIKGLNNAGFTDKDFRAENNVQEPEPQPEPQQPETGYKNTLDVSVFATSESSEPLPNETTCSVNGLCADCKGPDSICAQIVTTRLCKPAGRIKVILVGEDLGF